WVLDIFSRYRWQLTAVTVGVVGLQVLLSIRGDKGDVHDLIELEHDLEHEGEDEHENEILADQETKTEVEIKTEEQD
ncbi:MAG: hypothetical protein ACC652_15570, partial [Acidimicrobiales bacterium]